MKMVFTGGRPETKCGAGSTVANTSSVRAWLPGLFERLEVNELLDAPCGDFNWMSHTDLSRVCYIGCDCDPEHCDIALSRLSNPSSFSPRYKFIKQLDILIDPLPRADVMLCREFLQHLPNIDIADALDNFLDSNITWLLCTSHGNSENVDIEKVGMFRPLNLMVSPFGFTEPRKWVEDQPGSGRILGLWHCSDILAAA